MSTLFGIRGGNEAIPYHAREKVGSAHLGFGCIGGLYCTIRRCWVSISDGDRIEALYLAAMGDAQTHRTKVNSMDRVTINASSEVIS